MLWFIYNLIFPLVFLLMLPKFISRMLRRGGYRKHFEQRVGIYGHGTTAHFAEARRIWIHAVSVGELRVALRFVEAYRDKNPEARFVVSTATSTAHTLGLRELDRRDVLIYFPTDFRWVMRKALDAINPLKLILVECEFWPNLIRYAHRRGIPVSVINGRVSDSSFKGYMRIRLFTRHLLELIDPLCMQSQQDVDRMVAMGAPAEQVQLLGSAKYDLPPPAVDAADVARSVLQKINVPNEAVILLGGSTWSGEEEVLCKIYKKLRTEHPNLFLVLVPRHAERRDEVVQTLNEQKLTYALRSADEKFELCPEVLVVDTTGELMSFYAASDLVFVGKSLCKNGGQNPIEPALFGKPVIVGPNMENFPSILNDFLSEDGLIQVSDAPSLESAISNLLSDESARAELGASALKVIESRRGAVERMVEAIG